MISVSWYAFVNHDSYTKWRIRSIWYQTRLSSIESPPKKVVVVVNVVVVVIVVVGVIVVVVFVVVVTIVGHKNLTLKFGQNWVNNKWYIVVVVFIVLVLLLWLIQKPSFKTWSD